MTQGLAEAVIAPTTPEYPDRFTRIVRQHQSMVFSIAYACLRNRPLAEDIAQDVFLALYRKLPALESDSHVVHWLRRVTSHRMIDEVRERRRKPQAALEDVREPAAPLRVDDPLLSEALQQLVSTLPERARLIVILRFQEEMELAEIAETLDMPVGTVKSRLQRSLALLRDKLTRRDITPRRELSQ
jgi:RNA polymerase sigma-70 factor (ECF subfamily)